MRLLEVQITDGQMNYLKRKARELKRQPVLSGKEDDLKIDYLIQGMIEYMRAVDSGKQPAAFEHKEDDREVED